MSQLRHIARDAPLWHNEVTKREGPDFYFIPENKVNVSNDTLRRIIKDRFGVKTIKLYDEPKAQQDHILGFMKGLEGVNLSKIARITGLSPTRVRGE